MTEKEMALYLKRLSAQLRTVYNTLVEEMPIDAPRQGLAKHHATLAIQRQEDLWRESHPDADVAHVLISETAPAEPVSGKFKALAVLDAFIEDLNNDIATLLEIKT